MRGSAPLLVALGSSVVLGESLSPLAWAGVLGVTLGVAMVGLAHPGEALHHRRALAYALANAVVALYIFLLVPEYLLRFIAFIASRCIYRFKLRGEQHIPTEGAAIIACNCA